MEGKETRRINMTIRDLETGKTAVILKVGGEAA